MKYLERSYMLEPILGKNYRYESVKLGVECETIEDGFAQIEQDLKTFINLEKQANPVKTGVNPF